jgi:hypothetical protein
MVVLGVGGLNNTSNPLHHLKELGLDSQMRAHKAALELRKQQTTAGGWVLRSGRGQLRETGSTSAAPPAPIEPPPTPDSTDLKTSANLGVTSTSSRSSIVKTPDLRTS